MGGSGTDVTVNGWVAMVRHFRLLITVAMVVALFGVISLPARAATPGIVTTSVPGGASTASLEVFTDGSVGVVATSNDKIIVLKYGPNGALVRSFGTKGIATVKVEGKAAAAAIAVEADGKVVVAGTVGGDVLAARFTANGKPDQDFNNGKGYARTDLGAPDDAAVGVAVSSAGAVFVLATTKGNFGVVKYTTQGKRDDDFGRNGIAITDLGGTESAAALAVRSSGEVLAVGTTRPSTGGAESFAMVQYDNAGKLDSDFGPKRNGKVIVSNGRVIRSGPVMVLDSAGNAVVAGTLNGKYAVARYTVDGRADTDFGRNGTATADQGGDGTATTVGVWNSTIIVAGTTVIKAGDTKACLVSFDVNGTKDTDYGKSGVAKVTFAGSVAGVVLNSAGQAVIGGTIGGKVAVARFTTAGQLDAGYTG
jgi:uncharacterized delta-60 repeat protein